MGGRINPDHLSEVLPKWPEFKQRSDLFTEYRHSLGSAEGMAKDCLNVTFDQKILYVFLRDNVMDSFDQRLFDEMFSLTDDLVNREVFRKNNPICFGL